MVEDGELLTVVPRGGITQTANPLCLRACSQEGNCVQGSWQNTVSSWYRDNLRISIPVTVVGGIVVLLILFGIIRCCVRSCGGGGKRGKAPPSANYYGAPPVPQQQHYGQQQYYQQPMVQQPQQAYQSYGGNGYR